jgi:hypothetical protein
MRRGWREFGWALVGGFLALLMLTGAVILMIVFSRK